MIAIYIQELLATNNRVILPNFGAFLVRATSKSKDANTLVEKLKDVYFSPFLKFNDELLEKYIISKEGISKPEASEKIKKFIEEVKSQLDNEKPYDIKSFGSFISDKQGKIQFIPVIIEVAEEKTNLTDPETKKTKGIKQKETTKKTIKEPAKVAVKEPEKATSEIIIETKKPVSEIKTTKEIIKEEPKVETKQTVISKKEEVKIIPKNKKSSINKGLVWSIALGLPIAAIFIWGLLNLDTVNKILKKDNKEKVKTENTIIGEPEKVTSEGIIEQEIVTQAQQSETQEIEQEKSEETAKQSISAGKKYYIIAGSFKNADYASTYLKKLQEQGFPAEKLAERNGMHAVSFNSFTDKQKAFAEYKFITQEKKLQAWILYY